MPQVFSFLDRFKDPGSIRSLVLALFLIKGQTVDDGTLDMLVNGILIVVSVASFLMKPTAVVAVEAVTAKVEDTVQLAKSTVQDAQALVTDSNNLITRLKGVL